MIFEGIARRFTAMKALGKGLVDARFTGVESIAVAQVEPAGFEMTRAGRRFYLGNSAAITGIAPVQALPTTTSQWAIWNDSPSQTYIFEEVGMYLTSGTPGVAGILLATIFRTPSQTGANVAGATVTSASGTDSTSRAIVKTAVTITTPAAPVWYPIASNFSANVTAFASSTFLEHRNLQGRIAVPPGYGLGLNVVSPAGTTPLFAPFASWVEIEADME